MDGNEEFGKLGLIGFRSGDRGKETSRCLADLGSSVEGGAHVEMKGQLDGCPRSLSFRLEEVAF